MRFTPRLRRFALLLAALFVVTGAAGSAHVHRAEADHAPLEAHGHSACALCVHAEQTVEPAPGPAIAPPPAPTPRSGIASPFSPNSAAPRGAVPGRAPPR